MGIMLSSFAFGAPRLARRALSFLALAITSVGLSACGDDSSLLSPASTENIVHAFSAYAVSGTAASLPASYRFTSESLERPQLLTNGAVNFDVAFDLTADNRAALIPVRVLVPMPPVSAPSVGFRKSDVPFSSLERAPNSGFVYDSTIVVQAGETVVVQLQSGACYLGDPLYAKLVIDSIIPAERRLVVRSLTNRNCGYRALTVGLPKN